jgi:hypothetical protein
MADYTLVGFGDSWAHGSGLDHAQEQTYLEIAAEQLGVNTINCAAASSSIPHLVLQFQQFLTTQYCTNQQYLAVFFITAQERTFFIDPNTLHTIHSSPCKLDFNEQEKNYYKHYSDQYQHTVVNTAMCAIEHLCNFYKIPHCYIPGWQTVDFWSSIDTGNFLFNNQYPVTKLFGQTTTFTDLMNSGCKYLDPTGHPNQLGHQVIADALVKHIIDKVQ